MRRRHEREAERRRSVCTIELCAPADSAQARGPGSPGSTRSEPARRRRTRPISSRPPGVSSPLALSPCTSCTTRRTPGRMSTSPVHTLHPPPTPSSSSTSPCPEPASLRTASRSRATLGLSNLTTRSSSASRIYCPEQHYAPLVSPVWPGAASVAPRRDDDLAPGGPDSHAYRAWRREARAGALRSKGKRRSLGSAGELAQQGKQDRGAELVGGGGRRRASKGKDKAVAFVVGISSSGDEGDAEYEDEDGEAGTSEGAHDLLRFGHLLEGDALVPREPGIDELIRAQVRPSLQSLQHAHKLTPSFLARRSASPSAPSTRKTSTRSCTTASPTTPTSSRTRHLAHPFSAARRQRRCASRPSPRTTAALSASRSARASSARSSSFARATPRCVLSLPCTLQLQSSTADRAAALAVRAQAHGAPPAPPAHLDPPPARAHHPRTAPPAPQPRQGLRDDPHARPLLPRRGVPALVGHARGARRLVARRRPPARPGLERPRAARERRQEPARAVTSLPS